MKKILIIEDDLAIAEIERDYLEIEGFSAEIAGDGIEGLSKALTGTFDLVVLDLMLPGMDGFTVCKKIREEVNIPIIMVTARQDDIDKIRGLGIGADDYVEKPFSPQVLVARIKSHISRYERLTKFNDKIDNKDSMITSGGITLQPNTYSVLVEGKEIQLKSKEFELLFFLMSNPDIVFSREYLYEKIWGQDAYGYDATVAVHINRIRKKIEKDFSEPEYLVTVWGAGYKFKNAGY